MRQAVVTPRDRDGRVEYDTGWKLWSDMLRHYPSAVHRRRVIVSWLGELGPRTVLDAGCGPGVLLCALRERLPDARFTGVDYAAGTCRDNQQRFPWARFLPLDLGTQRLEEQFEAVVCSEVLEHVEDHDRALQNLVDMTGRYLLLTVPAGPLYPLEAGFGHLRHYQLEPLCREIESLGLRIRRAQAWGFPFMTLFKWAANLRPDAVMKSFGDGEWSWSKKAFSAVLTQLFYLNLPTWGPQLFILAERR